MRIEGRMHDEREASRTSDEAIDGGHAGSEAADSLAHLVERPLGRRAIVLAGLGLLLGGCATSGSSPLSASRLPGVPWDADLEARRPGRTPVVPRPVPDATAQARTSGFTVPIPGLQSRGAWGAGPVRTNSVNPMLPIRWVTIHHDGMAYRGRTQSAARGRLRSIQSAHQNNQNWADIGYHFIIDRQGTVWQGRELRYQGAHVGGANEGNVGVMLMGNFQEQQPASAQVASLQRTVQAIQRTFRIPATQVRTHREWPTAATECPGSMLQAQVGQLRRLRRFA
jgi:hypothetical protein